MSTTNVEGKKYNRLTIINRTQKTSYGHWFVLVKCDCGVEKEVKLYHVTSGKTQSCGCLNIEKLKGNKRAKPRHGMCKTRTYVAWESMKQRCASARFKEYYADRGIDVCEQWTTFEGFFKDMGEAPEGATLDRINNDKGYYPGNCRWTTQHVQSANTRIIRKTNTSGYRGVSWHKSRKKWRAYIQLNGRYVHLGMFNNKESAAKAYNAEAQKHPEYPLNEVS